MNSFQLWVAQITFCLFVFLVFYEEIGVVKKR